jgi:hypothetical protein
MLRWMVGVLLIASFSAVGAEEWKMSEFVIYLWGSPKVADLDAKAAALAEAGFIVVDWKGDELDVLQKHGLQGMVHKPTPKEAKSLAKHPALWGYHCGDEPYPEEQFPPIAKLFKELKKADPEHPPFVNMLSTTGQFLRTWMKVVQPDILSFDYYQWWWGSDRYFEKLEQFRQEAVAADVPLGSCLEVNADPYTGHKEGLPDNGLKLRQSVYTNLAYGVKMIEWFNSSQVFEPESVELTPAGRDVAALNAELRVLGPVLVGLKSLDVFNTPPLQLGMREAYKEHWVRLIGEETRAGLVQGMFEGEDGLDYMMVTNRDYRSSQSVVVRFQSKWMGIAPWHEKKKYSYAIDIFDKETGEWKTFSSSSFVGFTFVIGPGDGELFRIKTNVE